VISLLTELSSQEQNIYDFIYNNMLKFILSIYDKLRAIMIATHLPKHNGSPKSKTEPMVAIIKLSGFQVAGKTGPFLSITNACR
jgi:hypothetical protein